MLSVFRTNFILEKNKFYFYMLKFNIYKSSKSYSFYLLYLKVYIKLYHIKRVISPKKRKIPKNWIEIRL